MISRENIIKTKSFELACLAVDIYKTLIGQKEYVLSRQFLRSATSIGANIEEADAAYSRKEFASKMAIASKEAREYMYWIKLIRYGNFTTYDFTGILKAIEEIIRLLTSIVKTSQAKLH